MAQIAKTKKIKLSKLSPDEVAQRLFVKFILFLRGEEVPVINNNRLAEVEWDGDSFKPSEEDIATVFSILDSHWRKYLQRNFKESVYEKYGDVFKEMVSEEWKASRKKSGSTATENQS